MRQTIVNYKCELKIDIRRNDKTIWIQNPKTILYVKTKQQSKQNK